jgi:1-phosphofructokinase
VPRSTVGAGDCTLAGYLATDGAPITRLRAAVAWGRAAVGLPGSASPGPGHLDLASVQVVAEPDPSLAPGDLLRTAPAGLA